MCLNFIKKNRKMSTCSWLDSEPLGSRFISQTFIHVCLSHSRYYGSVSTRLVEQIHACIVFRPCTRLMPHEDNVEII